MAKARKSRRPGPGTQTERWSHRNPFESWALLYFEAQGRHPSQVADGVMRRLRDAWNGAVDAGVIVVAEMGEGQVAPYLAKRLMSKQPPVSEGEGDGLGA
jgi:hypothetical protein